MLKDLSINELSRMIFLYEHCLSLYKYELNCIDSIKVVPAINFKSYTESQLHDMKIFYNQHVIGISEILSNYQIELSNRVSEELRECDSLLY